MIIAERARRRAHGLFYGWFIVAAGTCLHALQSMLLQRSFGAYAVFLEAEFGWSKTTVSGAFSLQQVESGLLGPVQGWLIDRFGPRATMRIGTVMFGAGFIFFSRMDSVLTFYLSFVLMAVGSSLSGFFPISVTIINWFVRRRSRRSLLCKPASRSVASWPRWSPCRSASTGGERPRLRRAS